ncbi:hypothetical protein BDR26DRAFT_1004876 [Obelidium mucronatum]|nr:hypothetical protein BDR26DRAFT_1004876 [Obelidium mucronatum]
MPTTSTTASTTDSAVFQPAVFPVPRTQTLAKQFAEIAVPSHAAWFSLAGVAGVERRALPEFFNGRHASKTPQLYVHHRNFMVNAFRANPHEYLCVTACRRNLVGDVAAVVRIHAFLEQWGLVNYQLEPDARPSRVGPVFHGHFRITAHTPVDALSLVSAPSAVDCEPPKDTLQSLPPATDQSDPTLKKPLSSSQHDKDVVARLRQRLAGLQEQRIQRYKRAPPITCSSCGVLCGRSAKLAKESLNTNPTNDPAAATTTATTTTTPTTTSSKRTKQTETRWHCIKAISLDVCGGCFEDGRFPSHLLSCDFVKIGHGSTPEEIALRKLNDGGGSGSNDPTEQEEEDDEDDSIDLEELYDNESEGVDKQRLPWTQEEVFLLLEGVEHFDEDWGKVAFHIGTRSKEECVERFLGMTIEEPYLVEGGGSSGGGGVGVLAYRNATELLNRVEEGESSSAPTGTTTTTTTTTPSKKRKRKLKDVKPMWPVSVLEALPVTPVEDPGMALSALLASVVDKELGKAVADAGIRAYTHHHHHHHHHTLSSTEKAKHRRGSIATSPTKSPKLSTPSLSNTVAGPPSSELEIRAAELQLKKVGLVLARFEKMSALVEHERCRLETDRRSNIIEGIAQRREMREIRKKLKTDEEEVEGLGGGGEQIGEGGAELAGTGGGDGDEEEEEDDDDGSGVGDEDDDSQDVGTPPNAQGSNESNFSHGAGGDGDDENEEDGDGEEEQEENGMDLG